MELRPMPSGVQGALRPYPAIVPIELALAVAAPVAAILLVDLYWVPLAIFLMASIPAGIALYINGFLPVPRSIVLLGVALYVAGGLLSTLVTTGATFSEFSSLLGTSGLILYFVLLLSLVPLLERGDAQLVLLAMVLACGVASAINALLFFSGDPRAILHLAGGRFAAAIGVPGSKWPTLVSGTCAVFFSAAFALVVSSGSSRLVRIVAAAAAVPIGVVLILTQGRGGYLGALAAMLSLVPFVTRRMRMAIVASIVGALLLSLHGPIFDALFQRGMNLRDDIWVEYLQSAAASPLIGEGLLARIHRIVDGIDIFHPHNLLLSAEVRGGVLSLVGMALMLGGGLYWSWRHARRSGDPVFLAMTVAISVAGMFDYEVLLTPPGWTWVAIWLPFGLAAGAEGAVRRDAGSHPLRTATAG